MTFAVGYCNNLHKSELSVILSYKLCCRASKYAMTSLLEHKREYWERMLETK